MSNYSIDSINAGDPFMILEKGQLYQSNGLKRNKIELCQTKCFALTSSSYLYNHSKDAPALLKVNIIFFIITNSFYSHILI